MRKPVFRVSDQSDTNRAVQPQKMARGFRKRNCTIYVAKTKVLISCTVMKQLSTSLFPHMQEVGFLMTWFMFVNVSKHSNENNIVYMLYVLYSECCTVQL